MGDEMEAALIAIGSSIRKSFNLSLRIGPWVASETIYVSLS